MTRKNNIYNSPSTKNANTPVKKALMECNNKLSAFLSQLNVNLKNKNKREKSHDKENEKYDDVCKGIENMKF